MTKVLKHKYGIEPGSPLPDNLRITFLLIEHLVFGNRRMRRRSTKVFKKLCSSIKRFGIVRPILIDQDKKIIDGHAIVEAALELGLKEVPVLYVNHLDAAELKALAMVLNKTQELGQWNFDVVKHELELILELDTEFDLDLTGFEPAELDIILSDNEGGDDHHPDPADMVPAVLDGDIVSITGDLFILGNHILYCGDARNLEDVQKILGDECADLVFTDHPYNLASRSIGGLGKTQHADFKMAAGEMSLEEFEQFLWDTIKVMIEAAKDGAVLFFCIDWRSIELMLKVCRELGLSLLNICVWTKQNGGMGSFLPQQT